MFLRTCQARSFQRVVCSHIRSYILTSTSSQPEHSENEVSALQLHIFHLCRWPWGLPPASLQETSEFSCIFNFFSTFPQAINKQVYGSHNPHQTTLSKNLLVPGPSSCHTNLILSFDANLLKRRVDACWPPFSSPLCSHLNPLPGAGAPSPSTSTLTRAARAAKRGTRRHACALAFLAFSAAGGTWVPPPELVHFLAAPYSPAFLSPLRPLSGHHSGTLSSTRPFHVGGQLSSLVSLHF